MTPTRFPPRRRKPNRMLQHREHTYLQRQHTHFFAPLSFDASIRARMSRSREEAVAAVLARASGPASAAPAAPVGVGTASGRASGAPAEVPEKAETDPVEGSGPGRASVRDTAELDWGTEPEWKVRLASWTSRARPATRVNVGSRDRTRGSLSHRVDA